MVAVALGWRSGFSGLYGFIIHTITKTTSLSTFVVEYTSASNARWEVDGFLWWMLVRGKGKGSVKHTIFHHLSLTYLPYPML